MKRKKIILHIDSDEMKCLVIQTAFIGDVVLALPIAQVLHKQIEGSEIHFLVRKGNENLLENHPSVQQIWIWDKKAKYRSAYQIIKEFRKEKYDVVINVQRYFMSGLITMLSGGKQKIGFKSNPFSSLFSQVIPHSLFSGEHEVQRNLKLLSPLLSHVPEMVRPKLYPSEQDYAHVSKWKSMPYVILSPSSVWFTKMWHKENWRRLAQQLSSEFKVYLIGGKGDFALYEEIRSRNSNIENLAGALTYLQSCALMVGSKRVITNDSAPLHFASAMNVPTTSIFCSTTPRFGFGPLSNDSIILSEEKLPCKPCGTHGKKHCPQKHFLCSQSISVNTVLQTIT